MKRIKAIVSILALGVFALAMMGCPVAYVVSNPYVYTPATTQSLTSADTLTFDTTDILKKVLLENKHATAVTVYFTATSGSDWNMYFSSEATGGGLVDQNFVSTFSEGFTAAQYWTPTEWWSVPSVTNYIHFGGTVTTRDGANVVDCTGDSTTGFAARGGGLVAKGVVSFPFNGSVAKDLNITTTAYSAGTLTVDKIDIAWAAD